MNITNHVSIILRRKQTGPLRRLCNSLFNWKHKCTFPYTLNQVQKNVGILCFIAYAELHRMVMKNRNLDEIRSNKIVATMHHVEKRRSHPSLQHSLSFCDKIIVVSREWKKHLIEVERIPEEKVRVIYNGYIGENLFNNESPVPPSMSRLSDDRKKELRREFGIPENAFVVGHQGREGEWRKDCPSFYRALDLVGDKVFPLFLEDASYPGGMKEIFRKGYERYRDFYNLMDLYVISSVCEGGPTGFIEAIACGVPVLSTKAGMSLDFNPEDWLVDLKNPEQMAERILYAANNSSRMRELGSEMQQKMSWLTWEWVADQYYEVFEELLCQR